MTTGHWHTGHNVAGYSPDPDAVDVWEDWPAARDGLIWDLKQAQDFAYQGSEQIGDDWDVIATGEYPPAIATVKEVDSTSELVVYVTGQPGEHTIPTAYWLTFCQETECRPHADREGLS